MFVLMWCVSFLLKFSLMVICLGKCLVSVRKLVFRVLLLLFSRVSWVGRWGMLLLMVSSRLRFFCSVRWLMMLNSGWFVVFVRFILCCKVVLLMCLVVRWLVV